MRNIYLHAISTILSLTFAVVVAAQVKALKITPNFKTEEVSTNKNAAEFTLNRPLEKGERLAVTLGKTDVTSLFQINEKILSYNTIFFPLTAENSRFTFYLVDNGNNWRELQKFNLTFIKTEQTKPEESSEKNSSEKSEPKPETQSEETPKRKILGFEKLDFLPTFTLGIKSQAFQATFPAENRPERRAVFTDFTLQSTMRQEIRRGNFSLESSFEFAGSSFKEEALRFGTLGEKAPQIDLSSYLMQFTIGKVKFNFGHTSFGNHRHLVNSFSARGLSVTVPINKFFDISAGILNGTSFVGFGNFSGINKIRHQVQGATFGIEFEPKRATLNRLEISLFNAYIQPLNSVSEGRVNDSERSRGTALRYTYADKSDRFKVETGFSISRFLNPLDQLLDPDGNAVPVPPITRTSHYIDADVRILKDIKITENKNLNLNFAFRHEYVEPLYKSLGASTQADKTQQDYSLDASLGEITLQISTNRFNDNLRNVPSILKSLTRGNRASLTVPLTAIFNKPDKPSPFLPRLSYSYDRSHQFGAGIPVNGGFETDLSSIPNQFAINHSFSSNWQFKKVNFEYRFSRSTTDNEQTGRETADQRNRSNSFSVGYNPFSILSFNVSLNFDNSRNFETAQVNRTTALNLSGNWQVFKGLTFAGNLSHTLAGDIARTNNSHNTNYDFQLSYSFNREKSRFKKFGTQMFFRFADTFSRTRDFSFNSNNLTRTKIINAGMTFNIF